MQREKTCSSHKYLAQCWMNVLGATVTETTESVCTRPFLLNFEIQKN